METTLKDPVLNNYTAAHTKDSRSQDFNINECSKADISLQAILSSSAELLQLEYRNVDVSQLSTALRLF